MPVACDSCYLLDGSGCTNITVDCEVGIIGMLCMAGNKPKRASAGQLTARSTFSERSLKVVCFLHRSWYTWGQQQEENRRREEGAGAARSTQEQSRQDMAAECVLAHQWRSRGDRPPCADHGLCT